MSSSAIMSSCGRYRYRLERTLKRGDKTAVVVMVNPSTADAVRNDLTIKKLMGFARVNGWARVIVVNLFAYRSTHVVDLCSVKNPIGRDTDSHIADACHEADLIVVAWGASKKFPPGYERRYRDVWKLFPKFMPVYSIGEPCKDGHPKHPSRLAYDTPLQKWRLPT